MTLKINACYYVFIFSILIFSCKNAPKDSIEKADSANKANLDTALNNQQVVVDEGSSDFLVRFFDEVQAKKELASYTMHNGVSPGVKNFAATLYHEMQTMGDSIQSLRMRKNIVLPSMISPAKQTVIDKIKSARVNKVDELFIEEFKTGFKQIESVLNDAMQNAKDQDVRSFADISLIIFKKYLSTVPH